ncbi:MAG: response regulator [Lachnospiraceae bacterium]|nr:response regulator [Lachnospiraceae bacterium]
MRIIAVDDEKLALEGLMTEIALASPDAELRGFRKPVEALNWCRDNNGADVAFLDIEMAGLKGVDLAGELIRLFPDINVIFTTGYDEYAVEAMAMRASGYVLKPVTAEKIRTELSNLRNKPPERKGRLYIRTFGTFEVFLDGIPVKFKYQKTKELLAWLIDRRGALSTNREIISVLWEDDTLSNDHSSYLKNIRTDLLNTLEECGYGDCIVRERGAMGIASERIDCDYYEYLWNRDVDGAEELFKGEYMSQYGWGEFTLGTLMGAYV